MKIYRLCALFALGNAKENKEYEGKWKLSDKGEYFDDFLKNLKINWFVRTAAGLITPKLKLNRVDENNLNIKFEGPLGMEKEFELDLDPTNCDDFIMFNANVQVCAIENESQKLEVEFKFEDLNDFSASLFKNDKNLEIEIHPESVETEETQIMSFSLQPEIESET